MTGLPALRPGHPVGPYTVEREVGRGATAVVVLGRDPAGGTVAVKVRRRGVPAVDRRFLREFESMRALRLPGVVRVFDAGIEESLIWFSMEYVDGVTFLQASREVVDPVARVDRVLDLSCQLLDVLARLHAAGLSHRDIKPSNVLVDQRGRVQVLDFGIGRSFDRGTRGRDDSHAAGTMPYMAPEQLAGLPSDEQVDIFATGLMMHEALTCERPSPATPLGWIARTCLERPPPLASLDPNIPRRLSRVVDQLLEVDPRRRPSAATGATKLREVRPLPEGQDWPEPPFVEPGGWWSDLEAALGDPGSAFAWVLDSPAGSGRRRAVDQLQRHGLLQGLRTLHVRCDPTRVGGPIVEAIEAILGAGDDEVHVRSLVGTGVGALRQMWPHLPLPSPVEPEPVPTMTRVAEAAASVLARASVEQGLLLVFHHLERVDPLSARALHRLAVLSDRGLRLVLLHDPRWATDLSRQVIGGLAARGQARHIKLPPLDAMTADKVRAAVCPITPPHGGPDTPQRAVEQGYAALAAWRGESWTPPDDHLWPFAVIDRLPPQVLTDLVGPAILDDPWVRASGAGVELASATARRAARCRLDDLADGAARIADAWERLLGDRSDPRAIARLRLLAGEPARAREPSARAAQAAAASGLYAEARRWLFLHDTLPASASAPLPFDVARTRAETALLTEAEEPGELLVEACEAAASSPEDQSAAAILRAAYQLRRGDVRPALVAALRAASPGRAPSPQSAVRALLLATRCRLRLGQRAEAHAQLGRAEALLTGTPVDGLRADLALLRAELLLHEEQLDAAGAQAETLLLTARRDGQLHLAASAGLVLARVLRLVGRRGRAEALARAAAADASRTGDLALEADARLHLAVLLVERGDASGARPYLDAAIRRLRAIRADGSLTQAMRVLLQAAIADGDAHEANLALSALHGDTAADPEVTTILIRWWRSRGEMDQALSVPSPPPDSWAHLAWRIERARTLLAIGESEAAAAEVRTLSRQALERGFDELELYARLIHLAATQADESLWEPAFRDASGSIWTDLCFCALELHARRRQRAGDAQGAQAIWTALRTRCEELGYRPGYEEASGWLPEAP